MFSAHDFFNTTIHSHQFIRPMHPKMAPRRFVSVRRSQSLFEELWERPPIRRRLSRFGRSLALAGTLCRKHHDEKVYYPSFISRTFKSDSFAIRRAPMGSPYSAGAFLKILATGMFFPKIPNPGQKIVLPPQGRAYFHIML